MAKTEITGDQILDGAVTRDDLDAITSGQAVIRKVIAGTNVTLSWTGVDEGTGDVTVNFSGGGGGGAVDGTISVGTDTLTLGLSNAALGAQSVGIITELMEFVAKLVETVGTLTESFAQTNDTGSGTMSTGTETDTLGLASANLAAQNTGTQSSSLAAGSSILGTEFAGTATAVNNGGTVDWVNPSNATGDFNGTEATITATAASATMNDQLKLNAYSPPAAPSGFTRSKVEILVRHRWDSTGAVLETCTFTVTLRDSGAAVLQTLQTITQATASRGALATDTFDVTAAVAGQSDAQLAADEVWFNAVCSNLAIAQNGFAWQVDGAHMRITYTKATLP